MGEAYNGVADVDERLENRLSPIEAFRNIATGSVKTLQPIQGRLEPWVWNTFFNANGIFISCKDLHSLNLSPAQLLRHLKDNIHTSSRTRRLQVDLGEDNAAVLEEWVLSWTNADKLKELSVSNASLASGILGAGLKLRFPALTQTTVAFSGAPGVPAGRWSPSLPPQLTTLDVSDAGNKSITTAVLFDCSALAPLQGTIKILRLHGLALDNVSQLALLICCEELGLSGPRTAEDTDEQRIKIVGEMPALERAVLPDTTCKSGSWADLCATTSLTHVELQEVQLISPDPSAQAQLQPARSINILKVGKLRMSLCNTRRPLLRAYLAEQTLAQQQQRMQEHASYAMRQAAAAVQALGQGEAWAEVMPGRQQADVLALVQAVQPAQRSMPQAQQQGRQQQAVQALQHVMQAMLVCTQPQEQGQGQGQGQQQGQGLQAARQFVQQAREALQQVQGQGEQALQQAVQQAMAAMSQVMGQVLDVCRQPAASSQQAALPRHVRPSLASWMPNLESVEVQQGHGFWSMMMDSPLPLHTLLVSEAWLVHIDRKLHWPSAHLPQLQACAGSVGGILSDCWVRSAVDTLACVTCL